MATALLSLREDYWEEYELDDEDISFLYDYLLENETPLTSEELMPILVGERIEREKVRLEKKRLDGNDIYFPKEQYEWGINWFSRPVNGKKARLLDFGVEKIPH